MEESAMEIFLPVYESAIVLAGYYSTKSGRTTVTLEDVKYGWRFATRHVTGKQLGSLYPEIYEEESTDEDEEWEEVDEQEEPFTRYEGDDDVCVKMNECFDTWDEWEPETPAEKALKNSADRVGNVQE
jgi:hypothetical protein